MTTLVAKRCRHCDTLKVAAEFPRNAKLHDGFDSWCRACHADAVRESQRRHPETTRRNQVAQNAKARLKTAEARVRAAVGKSCPVPWSTCKKCGEGFPIGRQQRSVGYCSRQCRRTAYLARNADLVSYKPLPRAEKHCTECGAKFSGTDGRRFCTPEHAVSHHRKVYRDRKRASRRGAGRVGHVDRQIVFARDGWRCQLCKRPVSRRPKSRSMWPTLDHIVPLSAGGSHEYPNVQLAHMICNQRKHASGAGQLRLTL